MLVVEKQSQLKLRINRLIHHFIFIFMSIGLYSLPSFAKAPLCSNILVSIETQAIKSFQATKVSKKTSQAFVNSAQSELKSTTGNRTELKFTVQENQIQLILSQLEKDLQIWMPEFKLTSRDLQTPGFKNVTYTQYLTKLKINFEGENLTTKIRLRKYGLIPENTNVDKNKFIPIESMKDPDGKPFSWLEFKIEHPEFENSVLKPRIMFHDSFSNLMSTKPHEFLLNFPWIVQKTKELNPNNQETVLRMLEALKLTLQEKIELKPISETIYFRTSYVVNLKTADNRVNIQLTLDSDIHQYSSILGKEVQTYDPTSNLAVIEVKIPVQYSSLSAQNLKEVEGLAEIQKMLSSLKDHQSKEFEINKGKFSRAVRVLLQEKERGQNEL